jgi:hypothetical protein
VVFDDRAAWTGTYSADRREHVRVDAASWQGRPVFFVISGDWRKQGNTSTVANYFYPVLFAFGLALLLTGAGLAWRNLKLGRGDRRGAAKLAWFVFILSMADWVLMARHVADPTELTRFARGLSAAAFFAGISWVLYLAVEPYVRRYWPDALISWTRLQTGRLRDPVVGSHVLGGLLAGLVGFAFALGFIGLLSSGHAIRVPRIDALGEPGYATGLALFEFQRAVNGGIAFLTLAILTRMLVRKAWAANIVAAFILSALLPLGWIHADPGVLRVSQAVPIVLMLIALQRFGLLALWMAILIQILFTVPIAPASWYEGRALMVLLMPAAIAAWATWVIVSAQRRPASEAAA